MLLGTRVQFPPPPLAGVSHYKKGMTEDLRLNRFAVIDVSGFQHAVFTETMKKEIVSRPRSTRTTAGNALCSGLASRRSQTTR
jgi:hypothetical protein